MIPVQQTVFGEGKGNCFQAALASIFELHLSDVPDFCNNYDDGWLDAVNEWLDERYGLWLVFAVVGGGVRTPHGYHLIGGKSLCGGELHSVVGFDGVMVHDPYPSGKGLVTEETYGLFVSRLDSGHARRSGFYPATRESPPEISDP